MKHLCNCGEIVEANGESLLVANCPNCGLYYIYKSEVRPHKEESLLKEIQSKVHSTHAIVAEEDATPFVRQDTHLGENDVVEDKNDVIKVKPRAAKRR